MTKPKPSAYVHDDTWVLPVCPVAPAYTIAEAAQILGVRPRWLEHKVDLGGFRGRGATAARPIDHETLAEFIETRQLKRLREAARARLQDAFAERMTELGEPPTRGRR